MTEFFLRLSVVFETVGALIAFSALLLCSLAWPLAAAGAAPSTPEGLALAAEVSASVFYDLRPIEERWPELSELLGASRAGRSARVLSLAPQVLRATREPEIRVVARYLQATALERRGRLRAAARVWRALVGCRPFSDLARLRLAKLELKAGRLQGTLDALAGLSDGHPERMSSWLRMAEIELDRGNLSAAEAILGRIEPQALKRRDRDNLLLLTSDLRRRQGKTQQALRGYRRLWREGKGSRAELALERLVALGQPPASVDRMECLLEHVPRRWPRGKRGRQARREIRARIDKLGSDTPGLALYGHALMLARHRSRRARALEVLGRALRLAKDPNLRVQISYHLGDLQGKMGKDEEAIATLEPLLMASLEEATLRRLRWRLVRLYQAQGRMLDLERALTWLMTNETDTARRDEARWSLAWRRFRVGDCPEVLRLLDDLDRPGATFNHGRQSWRARARYWQGRCHAQLGHSDKAVSLWLSVIAAHPLTWYGVLALDRIRESRFELAERLRGAQMPAGGSEALVLGEMRLRREPALDAAVLLIRLGALREATALLRARLRAGISSQGVHLLAALYQRRGQDRMAFAVLQRYTRVAGRPELATLQAWRQAYPIPFSEDFERAAAASGLPRSWLYAVARHESGFNPRARSGAGAVGLVQLLPKVAAEIAKLYSMKVSRYALTRPGYNLDVGSRYLSELSSMYVDNIPLASAAYNAGPYAVRGWLKRTGVVPTDVFIESIPYRQARRYAMRVSATAQSYAWLYPQWHELALLSTSRPAMVPARLGPFMRGPQPKTSSSRWVVPLSSSSRLACLVRPLGETARLP